MGKRLIRDQSARFGAHRVATTSFDHLFQHFLVFSATMLHNSTITPVFLR